MRTFCSKNRVLFKLGGHKYAHQYQGTVFYSRCVHCAQFCKKKENFCNIFVIIYCAVAVAVDTVHSCPSSAQKNWSIFDCFTSVLVAWSTSCILSICQALTVCKPWCCYTSNCSNKRCACSNKRIIYKRKKVRSFFFIWNCSNKRFDL